MDEAIVYCRADAHLEAVRAHCRYGGMGGGEGVLEGKGGVGVYTEGRKGQVGGCEGRGRGEGRKEREGWGDVRGVREGMGGRGGGDNENIYALVKLVK